MNYIDSNFIAKNLKIPAKNSHKGDNGKLTIIGGSYLFHGASLFALKIASRIIDMVYYSSIFHNQKLTDYLQKNLYSFILIPEGKQEEYIKESDSILIGPGMIRGSKEYTGTAETGEEVKAKILPLLNKFPDKTWIIDAGALQAINQNDLSKLSSCIITPHQKEFLRLFNLDLTDLSIEEKSDICQKLSKQFNLTIVLKGPIDIISSPDNLILNKTGNEGMTKGGTGDCLAGLISALSTTHDNFTASAIGAYINGLAGDKLYEKVGPYFNADDLANLIPEVLFSQSK